jgi:hypothetical protein
MDLMTYLTRRRRSNGRRGSGVVSSIRWWRWWRGRSNHHPPIVNWRWRWWRHWLRHLGRRWARWRWRRWCSSRSVLLGVGVINWLAVPRIKGRGRGGARVGHRVRYKLLYWLRWLYRCLRLIRRGRGSTAMFYELLINSMVLPLLDLCDLLAWFMSLPFAMLFTL